MLVAPGLRRHPLDQVVSVLRLLLRHPAAVLPLGLVDAPAVGDHVDVAVRRQEARVAGLDASVPERAPRWLRRSLDRLLALPVRGEGEQRRERPLARRAVHVGGETDTVSHGHREVTLDDHPVGLAHGQRLVRLTTLHPRPLNRRLAWPCSAKPLAFDGTALKFPLRRLAKPH